MLGKSSRSFRVTSAFRRIKFKVTAKNGSVTLEGRVDWQFQKALAESSVKKLNGVSASLIISR